MSEQSPNVTWHSTAIGRAQREHARGHRGAVVWFTGLSGSGKSTLANALEARLHERGVATYVLDGDNLRHGLCGDLGFSQTERRENIRRVAHVSRLFVDAGLVVMTAFISPLAVDRALAREIIGETDFLEIYVATDLATCEARDPKGLYRKARAGQIENFTGIDAPYEVPTRPALALSTGLAVDHAISRLTELLAARGVLG